MICTVDPQLGSNGNPRLCLFPSWHASSRRMICERTVGHLGILASRLIMLIEDPYPIFVIAFGKVFCIAKVIGYTALATQISKVSLPQLYAALLHISAGATRASVRCDWQKKSTLPTQLHQYLSSLRAVSNSSDTLRQACYTKTTNYGCKWF